MQDEHQTHDAHDDIERDNMKATINLTREVDAYDFAPYEAAGSNLWWARIAAKGPVPELGQVFQVDTQPGRSFAITRVFPLDPPPEAPAIRLVLEEKQMGTVYPKQQGELSITIE